MSKHRCPISEPVDFLVFCRTKGSVSISSSILRVTFAWICYHFWYRDSYKSYEHINSNHMGDPTLRLNQNCHNLCSHKKHIMFFLPKAKLGRDSNYNISTLLVTN